MTSVATDCNGRQWVVREPSPGSSHDVRREAEVMVALVGSGVPVPRVIGHGTPKGGRPFMVMERIDGVPLHSEDAADGLSPDQRFRVGREMIELLARLHLLDSRRLGVPHRVKPFLDRQIDVMIDSWARSGSGSRHDPAWRAVLTRLIDQRTSVPACPQTVLHGDYRLCNVMVRDGRICGLLDWELSTAGDPIADLAWLLDDWRSADEAAIWLPTPTRVGGFPTRAELVDGYRALTGFATTHLGYYRGFTYWRAATLTQRVRYRRSLGFEDGNPLADETLDESVAALLMSAVAELKDLVVCRSPAVVTPKLRPRRITRWH